MPQALPLQDRITQSSQVTNKPRLKRAQFGDGYVQETLDGVNPFVDEWSIQYGSLTVSELQTLVSSLKAVTGVDYYTWTSPISAVQQRFKVTDGWSIQPSSGNHYDVSLKLTEWF